MLMQITFLIIAVIIAIKVPIDMSEKDVDFNGKEVENG